MKGDIYIMKKTIIKITALTLVALMMCAMLASCGGPNANPDKALESLKDNDYIAEKIDSTVGLLAFSFAGDVEAVVTGFNKDADTVAIFYYSSAKAANEAWDKVKKEAEEEKDDDSELVIKKSGKMIYVGTKDAIKAAK